MLYIICHGTMGSPEGNWFPWLAHQLAERGAAVVVPQFPTPQDQSVTSWLKVLHEHLRRVDKSEEIILIGHSAGATFLLHVLEGLSHPVKRTVFVSPVMGLLGNPEYDALNGSFVSHPFNWEKIRQQAERVNVFHGENDPYVPLAHAAQLAEALNVAAEVIPNGGHLNTESGYMEFPQLLAVL